jgi:hypothetical protein
MEPRTLNRSGRDTGESFDERPPSAPRSHGAAYSPQAMIQPFGAFYEDLLAEAA